MRVPVFQDIDGEPVEVGYQERIPGQPPKFRPYGIEINKCLPYIGRINETGVILGCEGPTDAMAAVQVPELVSCSVLGAWSSTTTPGRDFWTSRFPSRTQPLVACGDNDSSGRAFNQRLANEYGMCYPIQWPPGFPHKGDVKDWLSQGITLDSKTNAERYSKSFLALTDKALASDPLVALESLTERPKRAYASSPVSISALVEAAGGTFVSSMANGGYKYLCPFHDDRDDPSLTVHEDSGSFMCWAGCGKGGPVQFLRLWKGMSYEDAREYMRKFT